MEFGALVDVGELFVRKLAGEGGVLVRGVW